MRRRTLPIVLLLIAALVACDSNKGSQGDADASLEDVEGASRSADDKASAQDSEETDESDQARRRATSPSRAVVGEDPPLDVEAFVSKEHLDALLPTSVTPVPLAGKKPSPNYNAVHYHAPERETYGLGVQVWKLKNQEEARARIEELYEQYLNAQAAPGDAPVDEDLGFISERAGILTYVFATGGDEQGYVAAISCGDEMCPGEFEPIFELATTMLERMADADKAAPKPKR